MAQQVPLLRARTRFNEIMRKHLNRVPNDSQRVVSVNRGDLATGSERHNIISNHKYTWWSFFPMMIYEQFSAPMNLFFLVIATLQLWRAISPVSASLADSCVTVWQQSVHAARYAALPAFGSCLLSFLLQVHPITTWTPLLVVFLVSSYKAWSDDQARRRGDALANARQYEVWRQGKVWTGTSAANAPSSLALCAAQDIAVGDLVRVRDDEEVPCDLLLMKTAEVVPDGCAYVETANLDGETDLKVRRARVETQLLSLEIIASLRGRVHCEPPNADLYRLDAKMVIVGSRQAEHGGGGEGFTTPKPTLSGLPIGLALSAAAARVGLLPTAPSTDPYKSTRTPGGDEMRTEEEQGLDIEGGRGAPSDLSPLIPTVVRQRAGQAAVSRPSPTSSPDPFSSSSSSSGRPPMAPTGEGGTLDLPMGGDQLLQHGTVVRRSGWVLGIALYTGADSKLNQNKAVPPRKVAGIDREVNKYVVAVFTVQALLVLILGLMGASWSGNGNPLYWYLGWPRDMLGLGGSDGDVTDVEESTAEAWQGLQHGVQGGAGSLMEGVAGEDGSTNSTGLGSLLADVWADESTTGEGSEGRAARVIEVASKGARLLAAAMLRPNQPSPSPGHTIQPSTRLGSSTGHHHAWWAGFVLPLRFLLLSSMMIPISLKVTMDLAKAYHAWLITVDVDLWDEEKDTPAGVANTGISEELGRVGVVLTDKTGTLTENIMRLCALSVAGRLHGWHPGLTDGASCAPFLSSPSDAPMLDMLQALALCNSVTPEHVNAVLLTPAEVKEARSTGRARSGSVGISPDGQGFVRFVPESERGEEIDGGPGGTTTQGKGGRRLSIVTQQRKRCLQYASSSPDEEALVLGAARLGVSLTMRRTMSTFSSHGYGHGPSPAGVYTTPPTQAAPAASSMMVAAAGSTEKLVLSFGTPQAAKRSFSSDACSSSAADGEGGGSEERRVWVQDDWPEHTWEVLVTLPFDSDRKRMSVIVRRVGLPAALPYPVSSSSSSVFSSSDPQQLYLICKGADEVLWPRIEHAGTGRGEGLKATQEQLQTCAVHGLRTLLVAARPLSSGEYHSWRVAWEAAQGEVGKGRAEAVARVMDSIEHGLLLIGATAIEDKLQAGVPQAVSDLREAGVRFWMVTGDKHSTAVQIAKAATLIHSDALLQACVVDLQGKQAEELRAELRAAAVRVQHVHSEDKALHRHGGGAGAGQRELVVIVQGHSLRHILAHEDLCKAFIDLALPASAVIACRCTPAQKAGIVRAVRALGDLVTLAIGDGGNDVSMIQAADIGVGISGREGQQAARAADYSLARFSYLKKLLLVHGRYSAYRTSVAAQYCFYKSQAIALIQLMYNAQCGFSGCSLLDGFSLTTYNLLWTAIPGLAMLLDRDRPLTTLLAQPRLYKEARAWKASEGWWPDRNHYLSPKTFLWWTFRALWQSFVVLMVCAWGAGPTASLGASAIPQADLSFLVYSVMVTIQLVTVLSDMRAPTLYNYSLAAAAFVAYIVLQSARYSATGSWLLWQAESWWLADGTAHVHAEGSERGLPPVTYPADTGSTVQFLTMLLAFAVAAGPWLIHSPCWRLHQQPTHAPSPMQSTSGTRTGETAGATAEQIKGSPSRSHASSSSAGLAGSIRGVREQGRVVAGAMKHAVSAVAAGDRRALKAALAVAGKAVQAVGRPAKADDEDGECAAPSTPDGTGRLLGRAKSFVAGGRTLSTIPPTPDSPGNGEDTQGAATSLGSRFEVATSPEIARLDFRGQPVSHPPTLHAPVHAHRRLSLELATTRRTDEFTIDPSHTVSTHATTRAGFLDVNSSPGSKAAGSEDALLSVGSGDIEGDEGTGVGTASKAGRAWKPRYV